MASDYVRLAEGEARDIAKTIADIQLAHTEIICSYGLFQDFLDKHSENLPFTDEERETFDPLKNGIGDAMTDIIAEINKLNDKYKEELSDLGASDLGARQ